jgi:hypothetical protein
VPTRGESKQVQAAAAELVEARLCALEAQERAILETDDALQVCGKWLR